MKPISILSVGGSIVAPDSPDAAFIKNICLLLKEITDKNNRRFILIIGGGGPCRVYQQALREITEGSCSNFGLDLIGIRATHLNAQLVKEALGDYCTDPLITDPSADIPFSGKILVGAGWKPGFSTDNIAVVLAEKFGADQIINLSNIAKVYSDDPKKNPDAIALDYISWDDYSRMVGDEWTPGKNSPFDPVATKKAKKLDLQVITAGGRDLENVKAILTDKPFSGTVMGRR